MVPWSLSGKFSFHFICCYIRIVRIPDTKNIMNIIFILLLSLAAVVLGHVQPGMKPLRAVECEKHEAPYLSYHIHILFWQNNANSTNTAVALENQFMDAFNLTKEKDMCPFEPGNTEADSPMCVFPTDYTAAGPFLTAQAALFIPVDKYEATVGWVMRHRQFLDVFVHPNTGCGYNDHVLDGLWGGNKWELDSSIFA